MATRRFSVAVGSGGDNSAVTEAVGAATATTAIELTVDLGNVLTGATLPLSKQDVLQALQVLTDYVLEAQWPPA